MTEVDREPIDLRVKALMEVDNQNEEHDVFPSFDPLQHLRICFKDSFELERLETAGHIGLFDGGIRSVVFLPKGTFLGSCQIMVNSKPIIPTAASATEKILSLIGHVMNEEQQNVIVLCAYGQTHYQTCRDIQPFHDLLLQGPVAQMAEAHILISATEPEIAQREKMSCSYCQIQFDDRENMQTHQSSCNKVRDWQGGNTSLSLNSRHGQKGQDCTKGCRQCAGGDFKSTAALQSHLKCVHANNMILHVCRECAKGFATSAGLRQHLNEHAPIPKLFSCETCTKSFSQFSNLCRHKRMHVNCRQPLECQHCQQRFATINALAKHRKQFRVKNSINSNSVTTDTVDDQQNRTNMIQESNVQVDVAHETHRNRELRRCSSSISMVKDSVVPGIHGTRWITASQCASSTSGPKVMPFDENFSESKLYGGSGATFFSSQKLSDGTDISPQSGISSRDMESSSSHSSPQADNQNSSEENLKDSNEESRCNKKLPSGNGCRQIMEPPRYEIGEPSSSDTGIGTRTGSGTGLTISQGDCKCGTMDNKDTKPQVMLKPREPVPTIPVTSMDDSSTGVSSDNFYRKQSQSTVKQPHYTWVNTGALDLSYNRRNKVDTELFTVPITKNRLLETGIMAARQVSLASINRHALMSFDVDSLSKKVQSWASIDAPEGQSNSPPRKSKCEDTHYSSSIQNHFSKFNIEQLLKNQHQFAAERVANSRWPMVPPPTFSLIDRTSWAEMSMASESSGFNDQMLASSQVIPTKSLQIKNCRQHICHFCGKTFHRAANLKRHVRTHTGEQPYVCKTCTRAFSISSNLQRHIRQIHKEQTSMVQEESVRSGDVIVNPNDVEEPKISSNTDTYL